MEEQEYLEQRLDNQIKWYSSKSQWNQKFYKRLRVVEIVAATTIPLLAGYVNKFVFLKYIVGVLGALIAVVAGVIALYKLQENWIEYRTTCESLKHEKYFYLTKSGDYSSDKPFPLLVQRVEGLISKEHSKWSKYIKVPDKQNST